MLCRFFQQGECRFGDQCRYSHADGAGAAAAFGGGPFGGGGGGGSFGGTPFGGGGKGKPSFDGKGAAGFEDRPVCTFFLAGNCQYGDGCPFSHGGGGCGGKGKKGGKKGKKGKGGSFSNKSWSAKGQGSGKGPELEDRDAGKGPGGLQGCAPPPPGALHGSGPLPGAKALTGPYLGKGSELLKVWSMPEDIGHEEGIRTAIVMGDRVCTGGADYRLLLWRGDQQPGGRLALGQDNEVNFSSTVTALMWHAGSKFLFCGLEDGQIRGFRQEPFAELSLAGHTAAIMSLLIHEGVLLSGSLDGSVRAWRYDDVAGAFNCVATLPIPLGPVYALHLQLPDGLWVGSQKGISVLGLQSLQPVGKIDSSAPVVAMLPYEGSVLVALGSGVVKVFSASGQEQFSHGPVGEHTTNTAVAVVRHPHANKDVLLCGQEFGYVTAYDIPDFRPRGTFTTGYEGEVTSIISMGADGIFATFGGAGDVVIWRWERA
mmetsp:Transcript_73758/g.198769  ORF Transcript_73758/g.198769 Transcript_73758/m.198769 type:complete len:484 (+) Transcript_73758:59-1510(+)